MTAAALTLAALAFAGLLAALAVAVMTAAAADDTREALPALLVAGVLALALAAFAYGLRAV